MSGGEQGSYMSGGVWDGTRDRRHWEASRPRDRHPRRLVGHQTGNLGGRNPNRPRDRHPGRPRMLIGHETGTLEAANTNRPRDRRDWEDRLRAVPTRHGVGTPQETGESGSKQGRGGGGRYGTSASCSRTSARGWRWRATRPWPRRASRPWSTGTSASRWRLGSVFSPRGPMSENRLGWRPAAGTARAEPARTPLVPLAPLAPRAADSRRRGAADGAADGHAAAYPVTEGGLEKAAVVTDDRLG